jgi:hypothetical protein
MIIGNVLLLFSVLTLSTTKRRDSIGIDSVSWQGMRDPTSAECTAARQRAREQKLLPTDTMYPPFPSSLVMPPLPLPKSLKQNGVNMLFTFRVDSAGRVISDRSFTTPQVSESAYQKKLDASMRAMKFRPAILDGCVVEGTWTYRWMGA